MDTNERFDDSWIDTKEEIGEDEEFEPRFVKIKPKAKMEDDKPKFRPKKTHRKKTAKNMGW